MSYICGQIGQKGQNADNPDYRQVRFVIINPPYDHKSDIGYMSEIPDGSKFFSGAPPPRAPLHPPHTHQSFQIYSTLVRLYIACTASPHPLGRDKTGICSHIDVSAGQRYCVIGPRPPLTVGCRNRRQ